MSQKALSDLARVKVAFQLRAIGMVMGFSPATYASEVNKDRTAREDLPTPSREVNHD